MLKKIYICIYTSLFFVTVNALAVDVVESENINIKLSIAKPEFLGQIDLAALFFRSYSCVDNVLTHEDGSIEIKFNSKDCYMYGAAIKAQGHKNSFRIVRDVWQEKYMAHVDELKVNFEVPKTFDEFEVLTDYQSWDKQVIQSRIKDRPRSIYRNFDFKGHEVRVAETDLTPEECGDAVSCVEWEVAISFGKDYVFLVYDINGELASHAQFPGRKLKAPLSCNGCHYDRKTRSIGRLFKPKP